MYNIVRQEEDLRLGYKISEDKMDTTAFAVQTKSRTWNEDKGIIFKHCHRGGHDLDMCYAVIGYPKWWGDRPRSRTMQGRGRGALSSSGRGHGFVSYANAIHVPNMVNHEHAKYVITDINRKIVRYHLISSLGYGYRSITPSHRKI